MMIDDSEFRPRAFPVHNTHTHFHLLPFRAHGKRLLRRGTCSFPMRVQHATVWSSVRVHTLREGGHFRSAMAMDRVDNVV